MRNTVVPPKGNKQHRSRYLTLVKPPLANVFRGLSFKGLTTMTFRRVALSGKGNGDGEDALPLPPEDDRSILSSESRGSDLTAVSWDRESIGLFNCWWPREAAFQVDNMSSRSPAVCHVFT